MNQKNFIICLLLCAGLSWLAGCSKPPEQNPEPKISADQIADIITKKQSTLAAKQKFSEAVAAIKVCTTGSTYSEFRSRRLALEIVFSSNEKSLTDTDKFYFSSLSKLLQAIDVLWVYKQNWKFYPMAPFMDPDLAPIEWPSMLVINPSAPETVSKLKHFTDRQNSPELDVENNIRIGLSLVSMQCDLILR